MADQDQGAAPGDVALPLIVNFRDQGAGGIEHRKVARGSLFLDAAGDAMGTEDGHGLRRNLGQFLDEDRALVLQALDHVLVVHDLVAHVDGRAVLLQRPFHDLDRTHHARAKAARLRQINFHWTPITQFAPIRFSSPRRTPRYCPMSCNNRTIGFAHAVTAHPIWAPAHGGTALCVKKSATRKDRMKPWFRYRAHPRYYNRACAAEQNGDICAHRFVTFPPQLPGYTDRPA